MVEWYWVYRDFIKAYDSRPSAGRWIEYYEDYYMKPNTDLLHAIYFKPKGFSNSGDRKAAVLRLGKDRFKKLRLNIKSFNKFENALRHSAQNILSRFSCPPVDMDVYCIVGLDSTNIYSTAYNGKTITVLCLEASDGDMRDLNLYLSHECHHWARNTLLEGGLFGKCIGERAVSEGLAICCSEYLFPGRESHEYLFIPKETAVWVKEHFEEIDNLMRQKIYENDNLSGFFTRNRTSGFLADERPRIGYAYGYLKVREYLRKTGSGPIESAGVSWESVFDLS